MITVDTHAIVKTLVANGFTESEAESMLLSFSTKEETKQLEENVVKPSEFKEAIALLRNDIASLRSELKGDIAELRNELKSDLKVSIAEVKTEIARTKSDILLWAITPLSLGIIGTVIAIFLK